MFGNKKKPTIADVAREVNVSVATVSNVLNKNFDEVSQTTADRVLLKIREMGYVKNMTASALSGRASKMIAVVISGVFDPHSNQDSPEINPFYGEFLFRFEHQARAEGYSLCVYAGREEEYVNFLLQRHIDAAVILGVTQADLPSVLTRHDVPLVLFDSFIDSTDQMSVSTDEVNGGELSANRLISTGHKKLAFVGGAVVDFPNYIPAIRYRGAKKICDQAGIPLDLVEIWTSYSGGVQAAARVKELKADGVVTTADVIAAGVIHGLQDAGLRVPDDVAVMGYDNLPISSMMRPTISTIDQRLNAKIRSVMDHIMHRSPGPHLSFAPRLVLRQSA